MEKEKVKELEESLKEQEKLYCRLLVLHKGVARKAGEAAGYASTTARAQCPSWIRKKREDSKKPHLWDYYHYLLQDAVAAHDLNIRDVLGELKNIAFADILKIIEVADGYRIRVKSLDEIPTELRPAIQQVSRNSTGGITVKLYNKMDALKTLMDFISLDQDDGKKGQISIGDVHFTIKGSKSKLLDI